MATGHPYGIRAMPFFAANFVPQSHQSFIACGFPYSSWTMVLLTGQTLINFFLLENFSLVDGNSSHFYVALNWVLINFSHFFWVLNWVQHRVRLGKYKRSSDSIQKEGENLRAVWSPDTKLIAVLVSIHWLGLWCLCNVVCPNRAEWKESIHITNLTWFE